MATIGQVAVIVAQRGSAPEPAVEARKQESPTVMLLSQEPGESLAALGQRVRALVSDGWRIRSATFVARTDFGMKDVPATSELLRSLVASMVAEGSGRVHLQSQGRGTRSHFALQALAFAISDQVRGTGVEIVTGHRDDTAQTPWVSSALPLPERARVARLDGVGREPSSEFADGRSGC